MIEPWELLLHHSYSGTPGVVFDHSPGRSSHGRCVDVTPWHFVLDGIANGSGAVRFRDQTQIRVDAPGGWPSMPAFRAEVVFLNEDVNEWGGCLVETNPRVFSISYTGRSVSFAFRVPDRWPGSAVGFQRFSVGLEEHGIDPGGWIRAGILHDGAGTVEISLNGRVVETFQNRPLCPIGGARTVVIGNEASGFQPTRGLIDDVKIWRPNPAKATGDFTNRVVKAGLTDCWVKWGRAVRAAKHELIAGDGECAEFLAPQLRDAALAWASRSIAHSAATRGAWHQAIVDYRRLWSQGNVAEIGPLLTGLRDRLRAEGVPVEEGDVYRTMVNSRCFRELVSMLPPLDCDPQFTRMLSGREG